MDWVELTGSCTAQGRQLVSTGALAALRGKISCARRPWSATLMPASRPAGVPCACTAVYTWEPLGSSAHLPPGGQHHPNGGGSHGAQHAWRARKRRQSGWVSRPGSGAQHAAVKSHSAPAATATGGCFPRLCTTGGTGAAPRVAHPSLWALLPLTIGQHIRGVVEIGDAGDAGADGIHHARALRNTWESGRHGTGLGEGAEGVLPSQPDGKPAG